jgi:hypothetical protein
MYQLKRMAPLLVVAVIGYLLFANWKLEQTQDLAAATACGADGCPDPHPSSSSTSPFKHTYAWRIGGGEVEVSCRRGMILVGAWKCKVDREPAAAVEGRDDMRQYPHQTQRGAE